MIIKQRCIDCKNNKQMYHNASRCYDCAMKRRKILDQIRAKKRTKSKKL